MKPISRILLLFLPLLLLACFFFIFNYWPFERGKMVEFHKKELGTALFSGFLTLSAFIFTLETFIIVTIKENIYDNAGYIKNFEEKKKINNSLKRYAPLIRLKDFLFFTMLYSFLAAIFQLFSSLTDNWQFFILMMCFSSIAVISFGTSLFITNSILKSWLEFLEQQNNNKN